MEQDKLSLIYPKLPYLNDAHSVAVLSRFVADPGTLNTDPDTDCHQKPVFIFRFLPGRFSYSNKKIHSPRYFLFAGGGNLPLPPGINATGLPILLYGLESLTVSKSYVNDI